MNTDNIPVPVRVHYRHYRYVKTDKPYLQLVRFMRSDSHLEPLPKGGKTVCTIQVGGETFTGIAECSRQDAFCYKTGRKIALDRARQAWAAGIAG